MAHSGVPPFSHLDPGAFRFDRGGDVGAVLLHGFTGTPTEVRGLGEHLAAQGVSVTAPLLPGHGQHHEVLESTGRAEWLEAAREAIVEARARVRRLVVVGQSMGALLALRVAAERDDIDALVTLAPALHVNRIAWLTRLPLPVRFVPKYELQRPDLVDRGAVQQVWSNSHTPIRTVPEVLRLAREVRAALPSVRAPLLVVQGKKDKTVRPVSAREVHDRCGSAHKELLWLEETGHIVAVDGERERVWRAVAAFASQATGAPGAAVV
jgi:carboxylesterase